MKKVKRLLAACLFLALLPCFLPSAALAADSVPIEISTAAQLAALSSEINGGDSKSGVSYALTADIDLGGLGWTPIGTTKVPFRGSFDGGGHTINFDGTRGLFGCLGAGGTISDLSVSGKIDGDSYTGGICGRNYGGTIVNCYNAGTVSGGNDTGGICGWNYNGTITSCHNAGAIDGGESVGGVCGSDYGGTIENCCNTGPVSGEDAVGGVCGTASTVTNCYNTGAVSGEYKSGGICGYSDGAISYCYNAGTTSGNTVGGVCGESDGTVTRCYYLQTDAINSGLDAISQVGGTAVDCESKNAAAFSSGQIAYLLQAAQAEQVWGQAIGTDAYPLLTDESGKTVYQVTFKAEGSDDIVRYANPAGVATVPEIPAKPGYTPYWTKRDGTAFTAGATLTGNIIVTAKWTPNTDTPYKVEHYQQDLDGNYSAAPTETENKTGTTGTDTAAAAKSYTGFTGPETVAQTAIAGDGSTVVTIEYARNSYTLIFDANGGFGGGKSKVKYEAGISLPTAPTREGYIFAGWAADPTAAKAGTVAGAMPAEDLTYYAVWQDMICSVAFDSRGGSNVSGQTAEYGDKVTQPDDPTREGYTFGGWYKDPECTDPWDFENGILTEDVILYAKWTGGSEPSGDTAPSEPIVLPFTDVRPGAWYEDAVRYVFEKGLMTGYNATSFGPNDQLTRAQLAQILYNKEGDPAVTAESGFSDVKSGAWYHDAVVWAAENGVVKGYGDSRFGPNDNLTRQQLALMLWRYAGQPETNGTLTDFTDAGELSGYAKTAMRWAVENGIITGRGNGILDPKGDATRAEVAAMLMRFIRLGQ